jgi:hypothetical protein
MPQTTRSSAPAPATTRIATAFAIHTGWAVQVTLTDDGSGPVVADRRRALLCPDDVVRFAFHAAADCASIDEARRLITSTERAVRRACRVAAKHLDVGSVVAIPEGPAKPLPTELGAILASHPNLHTAEGELFRRSLVDAIEARGIPVLRFAPKTIFSDAAVERGTTAAGVEETTKELGRGLGPPWTKDHRLASAAALWALGLEPR